jgi:hypothetical protein
MKKLTLEIYLPAAQKAYDVQVPADARLSQVTSLAGKLLTELSAGLYTADGSAVLCDRETGDILNINMTVWELGLRNGSKLMLI